MLVESPKIPMTRMYFRSPQRVNKDTTYVFPRGPHNGVILGGVRLDNEWNGDVDLDFAEDIKRRCCALAPELGKPADLRVIYHGVGLRREFDLSRFFKRRWLTKCNSKQERWCQTRKTKVWRAFGHSQLWCWWCWIPSFMVCSSKRDFAALD